MTVYHGSYLQIEKPSQKSLIQISFQKTIMNYLLIVIIEIP